MAKYVVSYIRYRTDHIVSKYVDCQLDAIRAMENMTNDKIIRQITIAVFEKDIPVVTIIDEYDEAIQLAKVGYEDLNTLRLIARK